MQLTPTELQQLQQTLQDYEPAQPAIATLTQSNGDLETSLEHYLRSQLGTAIFGDLPEVKGDRSLRKVTLEVLRNELCSDEGFRGKVTEYTQNKDSAPLLTGLIIYLATQVTLPIPIDPGLATLAVLYITKIGLNIFCEYTKPEAS
jgi:hypothetical protein